MSDVPLREYIEQIVAEKERRLELRMDAMDKALALQAEEYERRLSDLNHEQTRLQADRERYLSKDKYDDWKEHVDDFMSKSEGRWLGLSLAWAVIISVASVVAGAVGFWIAR